MGPQTFVVSTDTQTADFWANLCYVQEEDTHIVDHSIHHVGWCASNDKPLVPPKSIEDKTENWKDYMVQRLTGSKTLPHNFQQVVREKLKSRLEIGEGIFRKAFVPWIVMISRYIGS